MKFDDRHLKILRQETGRFDKRFRIGPARWPHFDLLWIHEGAVRLSIGSPAEALELRAPDGILIFPDVDFSGGALGSFAEASISHFDCSGLASALPKSTFARPTPQIALHVQNLLRLSLIYAQRSTNISVRTRLLRSVLDGFFEEQMNTNELDRVVVAWRAASEHLSGIRDLSDVASIIGLSESTFRSLHRQTLGGSAGKHLQEVRLLTAEKLLSTTGSSISEIARQVGYAHPESFSAAFKASRGQSPGRHRRWSKQFA